MSEKAVFTNMCMIYDGSGNILVERRTRGHWQGIAFPGGHVERYEPFISSVIREVKEETGLTIERPRLCGVKQFFTDGDERYVVFLYKTDRFSGEISSSEEGEVFWIKRADIGKYKTAAEFEMLLDVFENEEKNEFYCPVNDKSVIF